MASSSDEQSVSTTPEVPSVSPGSSVSTTLKEEYEDLLKYAIVTPVLEPSVGGRATLRRPDPSMPGASAIGSFRLPNSTLQTNLDVTEGTAEHTLCMHYSICALLIDRQFICVYKNLLSTSVRACVCVSFLCAYSISVVKIPSSIEEDPTAQLPHSTPHPHEQSDTSSTEQPHHQEGDEHDLESVPLGVPPRASAPAIHSLAVPRSLRGAEEERDQELVQLEMQLEAWCGDMKRNILVGST